MEAAATTKRKFLSSHRQAGKTSPVFPKDGSSKKKKIFEEWKSKQKHKRKKQQKHEHQEATNRSKCMEGTAGGKVKFLGRTSRAKPQASNKQELSEESSEQQAPSRT
jgi:hypothetical protein